jgi:putative endonuclease
MSTYYVYILCSNKGRHYIGYTSNLPQRIAQHNRKHKGFTGTTEKWELAVSKEIPDKSAAMVLEKQLKSFKNSKRAIDYLLSL